MALNWICKLLEMPDQRIPKLCFLQLVRLAKKNNVNAKYNWVLQLKEVLSLTEAPNSLWDNLTTDFWQKHINVIIRSYSAYLKNLDLEKSQSMCSCQLYIPRSINSGIANYLLTCPLYTARIIAQIRLANNHMFRLSSKRTHTVIQPTQLCTICNLNEPENLEHMILRCPIYGPYREYYLGQLIDSTEGVDEVTTLSKLFINSSVENYKNIYLFVTRALKLRAFCLNI